MTTEAEQRGTRLRTAMVSALGDSALASLASFAAGLYAARSLELAQLGGYGIMFIAAFMLGSATITQLYFTPVEVAYLDHPESRQLAATAHSAGVGLLGGLLIGAVAIAGASAIIPDLPWGDRLVLAAGALALAALSPAQDHVRRMFHQVGRSERATAMSAVQLATVAMALIGLRFLPVGRLIVPLAALALANTASLAVGLRGATRLAAGERGSPPPVREILPLGTKLAISTQAEQVGGFVGVAVLGAMASAEAVGQYEATRLLAQPLWVLSTALLSLLRPRVMRAAQRQDRATAVRLSVLYAAALGAAGLALAVVAGIPWPGNPLPGWFPNAYHKPGMMALMIVATTLTFSGYVLSVQAVAAHRERELVRLSVTNQVVLIVTVAVLAHPLGSLALPLASIAYFAAWVGRFRGVWRGIYRSGEGAGVFTRSAPRPAGPASAR